MKQVWKTLDGELFEDSLDAQRHEEEIKQQVRMWNRKHDKTEDTTEAIVVHLSGKTAAKIFLAMIDENPDEMGDASESCGIQEEDDGWFYWDDCAEHYRWIDDDIVDIFIAANHQI